MGYAATTNLVYGVELNDEQARMFVEDLKNVLILSGATQLDMSDPDSVMEACQEFLALDSFVLRGVGADSRVHHCEWYNTEDPLWEYKIGFDLGGNGYACDDDLVRLAKAPVAHNLQNQWKYILLPILQISNSSVSKATLTTTQQTH